MADGVLVVQVLGVPVLLRRRAQQHHEELTRELTLIAERMRQRGDVGALPVRFVALVQQLSRVYGGARDKTEEEFERADESGAETVDLTYRLPASAADFARDLGRAQDEADEYCREGKYLLTLAAPPDVIAYRYWFYSQFTDQAEGRRPTRRTPVHPAT